MKVKFHIISMVLSLLVAVFLIGKYVENATRNEYLFSMDTLKALKYTTLSQKARGNIKWIQNVEMLKKARERLEIAVKIMDVWTDYPDEDIRQIATSFISESLKITNKFMKVESTYKNSKKDWIDEYEILIPGTESGYYRIYELLEGIGSVMAGYKIYEDGTEDIQFKLSVAQLASFLKYIDLNFNEQLREMDSSKQLREMGMINESKISRSAELVIRLRAFVENNTPVPIKK